MVIAVIGAGMIGAAAARHLAQAGHAVVLIGPPEPQDKATHPGVFASHYDEGRITRALDPWPFWSRASQASIARYHQIEADSGLRFFHQTGTVMAGDEGSPYIARLRAVQQQGNLPCEVLQGQDLAGRFPFFRFDPGTLALHETQGAGHINPRVLVRAQIRIAEQAGARILPDTVLGLDETPAGLRIRTDQGDVLANQALVAAGGFANMILPEPLPLTVYARTVVLLELDAEEAARLAAMPSLIWLEPDGNDPYLLPPIRYPDGRVYLKMGGGHGGCDPARHPGHQGLVPFRGQSCRRAVACGPGACPHARLARDLKPCPALHHDLYAPEYPSAGTGGAAPLGGGGRVWAWREMQR